MRLWISPVRVSVKKRSGIHWRCVYSARRRSFITRWPTRACFAVAGPVVNDQCKATNLPWVIDARALEAAAGIARVRLVNDFHAQALAVLELPPSDLRTIHAGASVGGGPVAILGAGTGLGEAFLVNAGDRYEVVPSEGGHVDFAPTSERQIDLLRYLRATLGGRVSYERVLSGSGLARLYEFLKSRGFARELPEVRAAMEREDPAAVVSRFGLGGQDPMCAFALDLFCEIYGQEAGNLALKVLALKPLAVELVQLVQLQPRLGLKGGKRSNGLGSKRPTIDEE